LLLISVNQFNQSRPAGSAVSFAFGVGLISILLLRLVLPLPLEQIVLSALISQIILISGKLWVLVLLIANCPAAAG